MTEEVRLRSWWVPVKNQEPERGYKGKFPESVMCCRARPVHRTFYTQLQSTLLMSSVVFDYR